MKKASYQKKYQAAKTVTRCKISFRQPFAFQHAISLWLRAGLSAILLVPAHMQSQLRGAAPIPFADSERI
jgi:hypothetical protein